MMVCAKIVVARANSRSLAGARDDRVLEGDRVWKTAEFLKMTEHETA
jgi:hypothetical protein